MKREFIAAISQLSAERNLPREEVLSILEAALVAAYRKDVFNHGEDISVRINPSAADIEVYVRKIVADPVEDPAREISLAEARELREDVQLGEMLEQRARPGNTGRIAAQAARQVVLQRLREAEHQAMYDRFAAKEGEIVSGAIQFIQPTQIYVNLGKTEALFPLEEQMSGERYYGGKQLKFYLLSINRGARGTRIVVSRSHPRLMSRLFELEIPEVNSGVVELKAVAREAGRRSKVAVSTQQESIDPVGCCLGPRSIRLQSIISELNGEKIDVIQWDADPRIFIPSALSPAQVVSIELNETERTATVVVPDKQLSLAIGKQGQNARLAAKLTGWRIDIKSASAAEAEKESLAEVAKEVAEAEEMEVARELAEGEMPSVALTEAQEPQPAGEGEVQDIDTLLASGEFGQAAEPLPAGSQEKAQIIFAEDILPVRQKAVTTNAGKDAKSAKSKPKGKGRKRRKIHVEDNDSGE